MEFAEEPSTRSGRQRSCQKDELQSVPLQLDEEDAYPVRKLFLREENHAAPPEEEEEGEEEEGEPGPPADAATIGKVFKHLDEDGDGRLNLEELRAFADFLGFEGTPEEWKKEFDNLVSEFGWDAAKGPDEAEFVKAVQDPDCNIFAEKDDAEGLLNELETNAAEASNKESSKEEASAEMSAAASAPSDNKRKDMIAELFQALDKDKNGFLSEKELFRFVQLLEYPNGEAEWAEDYKDVCKDAGADEQKGLSQNDFYSMTTDEESDMYVPDEDLENFVKQVQADKNQPEQPEKSEQDQPEKSEQSARGSVASEKSKRSSKASRVSKKGTKKLNSTSSMNTYDDEDEDDDDEDSVDAAAKSGGKEQSSMKTQSLKHATRDELVANLFQLLDKENKGFINAHDLFKYAVVMVDYPGTEDEFPDVFRDICSGNGWNWKIGMDKAKLGRMLNDDQGEFYVETAKLKEVLTMRRKDLEGEKDADTHGVPDRSEYILTLFRQLDANRDNFLQEKEMLPFVKAHINMVNDGIAWSMAYSTICTKTKTDPDKGLDLNVFTNMINDTENDAYCDNETLREIVMKLFPAVTEELEAKVVVYGTELVCQETTDIYENPANPDDCIDNGVTKGQEVVVTGKKVFVGDVVLVPIRMKGEEVGYVELSHFIKKELLRRAELVPPDSDKIRMAFDLLDISKDGSLGEPELFRFATLIGFEGNDDEFWDEYKPMCIRYGIIPDDGSSKEMFVKMVLDHTCILFCTATKLDEAIENMPRVEALGKTKRTPLLHNLFDACDADNDKHLSSVELLRFAKCVGFPGNDEDWLDEFQGLCEEVKADPNRGMTFKQFRTMVDDNESDYWCNDAQLNTILAAVKWDLKNEASKRAKAESQSARSKNYERTERKRSRGTIESELHVTKEDLAAINIQAAWRGKLGREKMVATKMGSTYDACGCGRHFGDDDYVCRGCGSRRPRKEIIVHCPARSELIKDIFTALDADDDRRLCREEMLLFARNCEFNGTDAEWSTEFDNLCVDYNWDRKRGVDVKGFMKFVNDDQGLCYCTDSELSAMHRDFVVMRGHGPMIDHMASLLPAIVDSNDGSMAKLAFRGASLKGVQKGLEDPVIPQPNSIDVHTVSDPLKKLAALHQDTASLTADQVAEDMTNVTKQLRQYTVEHAQALAESDEEPSAPSEESEENDEDWEYIKHCDQCGYKFGDGQRFCRKCGRERQLAERCPKCNAVFDVNAANCRKCGFERPMEDTELDLCQDCGHPFKDQKERFCRKCQTPRPLRDNQCECGAFFTGEDKSVCNACGMVKFDEKSEVEMIKKNLIDKEQFKVDQEMKKAKKLEKARQSIVQIDIVKQEQFKKEQKAKAVEQKKEIEKAKKIPPGSLMHAIAECDESVALAVIQHPGFNEAHTRDGRGCTTLHCAAERGLTEVCRKLLMLPNFRDAGVKDSSGWSALHRASKNGHANAAKCLVSHPALNNETSAYGRDGFTALHCAAMHGFNPTLKVLLDHPRFNEVNAQDTWGRTALHCAAEYNHKDCVKSLIEHNRFTRPDAKTKWGQTAQDIAKAKKHDEIVAMLKGDSQRRESAANFARGSFMDPSGLAGLQALAGGDTEAKYEVRSRMSIRGEL